MGFYDVVKPCVVGKLHYARPTTQPIEVDDAVAEPLVAEGCLQPYSPGGISGETGTKLDGVIIEPQSGLVPQWRDDVEQGAAGERPSLPAEPAKPRRGRRTGA